MHIEETWPWAVSRDGTYVIQPWLDAISQPHDAQRYFTESVNENVRRNIKRARRAQFVARRSRTAEDAAHFYADLLEPMAHARFGSTVMYGSIQHFLSLNGRTMHTDIVFLQQDGEDVAGVALVISPPRRCVRIWAYGMELSRLESARQRADIMTALNMHSVEVASALRYDLCFGLTRPFSDDGVYAYKRRWGAGLIATNEMARFRMRFTSNRERSRLARNLPLLVVGQDGIEPLAPSP